MRDKMKVKTVRIEDNETEGKQDEKDSIRVSKADPFDFNLTRVCRSRRKKKWDPPSLLLTSSACSSHSDTLLLELLSLCNFFWFYKCRKLDTAVTSYRHQIFGEKWGGAQFSLDQKRTVGLREPFQLGKTNRKQRDKAAGSQCVHLKVPPGLWRWELFNVSALVMGLVSQIECQLVSQSNLFLSEGGGDHH